MHQQCGPMPTAMPGYLEKKVLRRDGDIPWEQIGNEQSNILKDIRRRWKGLLSKNLSENYYHAFIAKHAAIFFPMMFETVQTLSKVRLGAELVTDFVKIYDEGSYGLSYTLIEIEVPWAAPFTKEGITSQRLNRAVHQILSWRKWLEENQTESRRLFPSSLHHFHAKALFRYTIIIGNRENSKPFLDKRNQLAESLNIEIRSYDWLTDQIDRCQRASREFGLAYFSCGSEEDALAHDLKNELANPFACAMSDPKWREFIGLRGFSDGHMVGLHADRLIMFRETNGYEKKFLNKLMSSRYGARPKKNIVPKAKVA